MAIQVKRIYEPPSQGDGLRVLVDRIWPRGMSKQRAQVDRWLKEIAPSSALRHWFGHDPDRWPEFKQRYFRELAKHEDLLVELLEQAQERPVTLLFAAREDRYNNAVALREYLAQMQHA